MAIAYNPDKHIRKAVFDLIQGIVVDNVVIKCYDSRVTGNEKLTEYVLLTTQTKDLTKPNKCKYRWETSMLIEIYTRSTSAGNQGSRLFLNNIEEEVYNLLLTDWDGNTGFDTLVKNVTFETQLETVTDTENIFRSFLRLNLTLVQS